MWIVNSLHADRPIIIDTVGTTNNFKCISFVTFKLSLKKKTKDKLVTVLNK